MKILAILLTVISLEAHGQSGFYDDTVKMMNGNLLALSCFQGKKVLVASVSLDSLLKDKLLFFDSLQSVRNNVNILIVPAVDFSTADDSMLIRKLRRSGRFGNFITRSLLVRKSDGAQQARIMKWLTNKNFNCHNDDEIASGEQWFFLDESGKLYAVLEGGGSDELINQLLDQPPLDEVN